MNVIDLRSDTVTKPTAVMLKAMSSAEVGDDVYGEDPTVRNLEAMAAQIMGKQAGLLVTSGTMGNLVAALTHTNKGNEVLLEADSHIYYYEVGGLAAVGGLMPRPIQGDKGSISVRVLRDALRPANIHFPRPSLLCLENTHNRAGGTVMPPQAVAEVASYAREQGLKVHLDGARIFNAAIALGVEAPELADKCDSVMFCLSKGLGAPVGSLLVGDSDFIAQARKWRKMLGGGMRQAGVIAAAGLIALEQMRERLAEDHDHAKLLAAGLAAIPKLTLDLANVQTNIVVVKLDPSLSTPAILAELAQNGVLASDFGPDLLRFVTHKDVSRQDIEDALAIIARVSR
ncbi:MAG: low-specificity L-threonine aldolase [Peptococcaceae bacterium]|nr:low-specificity L-threonine aldolase [Peptococcaceae bacterium]